jgi:glucose-6-phosphate isomerase
LDCFNIVKHSEDLSVLDDPRFKKWCGLKNFVIFGTGGSSLGGQVIHSIANSCEKNLKFVSNLDPSSLENLLDNTDFDRTGFLVISKSGETLETICQLLVTMDATKYSHNFKDKFVIVTEDKDSTLRQIANQNKFLCFDHPNTIGGRYSVFSLVGMIPAILCGLDPRAIRTGGRRVLDNFGNSTYKVQEGADFVFKNFEKGIYNHVSFIYTEKLIKFGHWLAQLYAESTGKDGKGITPLTAIGSVDQHSQLQLYLDGPQDKCFTFFYEKQDRSLIIRNENLPARFEYLKDKSIAEVFSSQCEATQKVLVENGFNVRRIEFPPVSSDNIGALFMHFMLEVACVCKLMEVNPFDQPAVERGKIITKELLSQE